jgi:type II secretory pathway component GspD/PulD (secretin)
MLDDGRIVLSSPDTAALDRVEDLLSSLTPPPPNYKVFYLKYASASLVTLNLKEYFEEEGSFDTEDNWWRAWHGLDFESGGDSREGLAQRPKIRFIYDFDTNSILVSNASPSQLAVVDSLVKIYDMPPSEESLSSRSFQMFSLKYSRAEAVAKTIKEVYRDLLSSKDQAFEAKGEKTQGSQTANIYRIGPSGGDDGDEKPTKVKASFDGALSVGVDEISNTVIVSAQEEWMPSIAEMIRVLDETAAPETRVSVYKVSGHINGQRLQAVLKDVVGEAWVGDRPPPKAAAPPVREGTAGAPAKPGPQPAAASPAVAE